MRILLADDHPVVRQGLRRILADAFGHVVVGEAANAQEALEQTRRHKWDVALLDITMPGRGGLEVLKEIKQEKPALPVLVLSIHAEDRFAMRALRAGAAGYLTKESVPERLVTAIKKVARGGKYISESLAEKLAAGLTTNFEQSPHEMLSDREYEVMRMIASGKTVSAIARELSLSVKTISTFRARILQKLRMKSSGDIIYYAARNNLID
jgi:two-component system, NarL family, invasion response regulator UvrY